MCVRCRRETKVTLALNAINRTLRPFVRSLYAAADAAAPRQILLVLVAMMLLVTSLGAIHQWPPVTENQLVQQLRPRAYTPTLPAPRTSRL